MDNDRTQIQRILGGEPRAFEALIHDHRKLVFHVVARLIPNRSDREEICQDVFVKVYQNLSKFQFESKLSTWIARIAYNTSLSYLEKKRLMLYEDLKTEEDDAEYPIAADAWHEEQGMDGKLMEREIRGVLETEITRLPVHYRTVLTLYHVDELSYEEIGLVMNMPQGTVKSYLFRARRMLKERLLSQYREEELRV
jgi:RNA polymerase sigma-70 factor (ECF subfamily)